MNLNNFFYLFLVFISVHLFYFQIKKLNIKDPNKCLQIFKSNNFLGLLIFSGIIIGKF